MRARTDEIIAKEKIREYQTVKDAIIKASNNKLYTTDVCVIGVSPDCLDYIIDRLVSKNYGVTYKYGCLYISW